MVTGTIKYLLECKGYEVSSEDRDDLEAAASVLHRVFDGVIKEWHEVADQPRRQSDDAEHRKHLQSLVTDAERIGRAYRLLHNLREPNMSLGPVLTIPRPMHETPTHS